MIRALLSSFLFLAYLSSFCQNATDDFGFKSIPVSAMSAAMGGNQLTLYESDVNQLTANPGLYDSTLNQSLSLSYLNYLTDVFQTSMAYAHEVDSFGLVSGYFRYLDYGEFIETDEFGNEANTFKSAEYEFGVSLTRKYSERINYGVTVKQFYSNLYKNFAFGLAADFGVYYSDKKGFKVGAALNNLGARFVDYNKNGSKLLAPSINVGLSKKFAKAPIVFALQYNNIETWDLARYDLDASALITTNALTGESTRKKFTIDNLARHLTLSAAFIPSSKFNIMGGFNFRRRLELGTAQRPALVGFSIGTQIKIKRFQLQYALTSYNINGASNHLTISTSLSAWYRKSSVGS